MNYYTLLGVSNTASIDEIKRAHRELYVKNHPDKFRGAEKTKAEQTCKQLNEAYATLIDPERKRMYDQELMYGTADRNERQYRKGTHFQFEDLFFNSRQETQQRYELDIELKLTITVRQAYYGCDKEVHYTRVIPCTLCRGSGIIGNSTIRCNTCGGTGYLSSFFPFPCTDCNGTGYRAKRCSCGNGQRNEKIGKTITIPARTSSGQRLVVNGMGHRWANQVGTLYIVLTVISSDNLQVESTGDLRIKVQTTLDTILKRGKIKINFFNEQFHVQIPPKFKSNTVLTVKGRGLKVGREHKALFIELIVDYPVINE